DSGWSAAECAEHLVLSEEALLGIVRDQIIHTPPNPSFAVNLRGKDGIAVQAMKDRSARVKTIDSLEPKACWPDPRIALDAFLGRRAATLDYARNTRDRLHHHAQPFGKIGLLDGYQWLLLLASHTDRHVAQMHEAIHN